VVLTERNAASGDENETNHDNYVWAVQITSFSRRYPFLLRKWKQFSFRFRAFLNARFVLLSRCLQYLLRVKKRTMSDLERGEEVRPSSCITNVNKLILIPVRPNRVSFTIMTITVFFTSRLIERRFTVTQDQTSSRIKLSSQFLLYLMFGKNSQETPSIAIWSNWYQPWVSVFPLSPVKVSRGPFLENSGNLSGPKRHFQLIGI